MDEERGIGKDGDIPWRIPADWQRFKQITLGHPVIMGRKTFESMGKLLPGRTNIVLTRRPDYEAEGCVVVATLDAALAVAAERDDEIYVIGGEEIFRLALPLADELRLTHVAGTHGADTFFPEFGDAFRETHSEPHEDADTAYRYADYVRTLA
ncbi:MAG: dihydrofolate reductase [bacterium]|nr:dihydrofolate reductase [bacterium]